MFRQDIKPDGMKCFKSLDLCRIDKKRQIRLGCW
jgi:hypothetical protein